MPRCSRLFFAENHHHRLDLPVGGAILGKLLAIHRKPDFASVITCFSK